MGFLMSFSRLIPILLGYLIGRILKRYHRQFGDNERYPGDHGF